MPTPEILIHHLTDVHVGPLHYRANRQPFVKNVDEGWSQLRHYVNYLTHAQPNEMPDLVIVSGDLTSYGAENEFAQVEDALREILGLVSGKDSPWRGDQPYLFLVPGNHDLDWTRDTYQEKTGRYERLVRSLGNRVLSPRSGQDGRSYADFPERNVFIYLFNTCSLGGSKDGRIEDLAATFRRLQANSVTPPSGPDYAGALADLEKLARKDPGFIEKSDLELVDGTLEKAPETRLKIAVMHHNLSSVPVEDIDEFDAIINAGLVKQTLLRNGFDLVLHGHRHFSHCSYEEVPQSIDPADHSKRNPAWKHTPYQQGLFVLSGETLGSKEQGAFWQLRVIDSTAVHRGYPPSSLVEVDAASKSLPTGYRFQRSYRLMVDRPTGAHMRLIQENLARTSLTVPAGVRHALDSVGPYLPKA